MTDYVCDLHCHTTRSDGNDTPEELIDRAVTKGMKVIAITDHDIVPPEEVLVEGKAVDIVGYASSLGVNLVKGIEVSCDTDVEDVHILGYGCDWNDSFFAELDEQVKLSKINSYKSLLVS